MADISMKVHADLLVEGDWANAQLDSGAGIAQFGVVRMTGRPQPIFLTSKNRGSLIIYDHPLSQGVPVPAGDEENHGFSWWIHNMSATDTDGGLPPGNPPGIPIVPLGAGSTINGQDYDPARPPIIGVGELALIVVEKPNQMNVYKVVANIRPMVIERPITITPGTPVRVEHGLGTPRPDVTIWTTDGILVQLSVRSVDENILEMDGGTALDYIVRIRP